jgi:hypothetical protein
MLYRGLFTQHLKFSQKLLALINEHFNRCSKSIHHPIQECINGSFIRFVQQLYQFNSIWKNVPPSLTHINCVVWSMPMVLQSLNSIDNPNPSGCNCGIRALKEARTLSRTMHHGANC